MDKELLCIKSIIKTIDSTASIGYESNNNESIKNSLELCIKLSNDLIELLKKIKDTY